MRHKVEMDVKLKATKIEWDVDKEDVEEGFSLPEEIDVPKEIVEEAMNKIVHEMDDYISNKTGFCHKGFVLECYSMTKKKLFEENERLKSQLKEQEAIRKLAEDCIYDIEDALYRGNKNDWASEAIDEFEEKMKKIVNK